MQGILRHREQVETASGLDVLAGIWLMVSPFVLDFGRFNLEHATANNLVLGFMVAVLASVRAFAAQRQAWLSWINAAVGLWVWLSPWILGFSAYRSATTNNIVLGVIVIVLACWSALVTESAVQKPNRFGTAPTQRDQN